MKVGSTVKLCRVQKGLTQNQLADKLSITPSYLSLLERDKREPTLSVLQEISNVLEVPLSIIFFLSGDKDSIEGLSPELSEKMSNLTLKLLSQK